MRLPPSPINTITAWLRTVAETMSIFSPLRAVLCRGGGRGLGGVGEGGGTEKKNTGVERAASGPDIPHLASTSGGKRSSGAFDTAITAENCGVRRFDGWMSRSCLTFFFYFFPLA